MSFGASPVGKTTFQAPSGGGTGSSNANGGSAISSHGANLLILTLCYDGGGFIPGGGTYTVTDTINGVASGNTWQHATLYNGTFGAATQIWYSESPAVSAGATADHVVTITTNMSGMYYTGTFMAWAGAAASSSLDKDSGATSNTHGTTINTGAVTPTVNGELIVTSWTPQTSSGGASVASGYSSPDVIYINAIGNAYGGACAYQVQAVAASIDATWQFGTGSGQDFRACAIATFKPSAGGGGFNPGWAAGATKIIGGAFQ